jgi:hypothetical protein
MLLGLLIVICSTLHAQHVFKKVKTCDYGNGSWGRWVNCSDDIRITNMAGKWGKGVYNLHSF